MNVQIIDDDESLQSFLTAAAEALGVPEIDLASSGEIALTHVIRRKYDLITLDINMPGASGTEVLPHIRNICPHSLIAVISGEAEEVDTSLLDGADVVLGKPVLLSTFKKLLQLAEAIENLLTEARQLSVVELKAAKLVQE